MYRPIRYTGIILPVLFCLNLDIFAASASNNQTVDQGVALRQPSAQDPVYWIELGKELWQRGDAEKSIDAFRKVIEINPQYESAYLELSPRMIGSGKISELIPILFSAHQWMPESEAIMATLFRALLLDRRNADAVDIGRKLLAIQPENASTLSDMGIAYMQLRQFQSAKDSLEKAVALDSSLINAWMTLGFSYRMLEDPVDAIYAFQEVLNLNPSPQIRETAWAARNALLTEIGNTMDGEEEIERELLAHPDNAFAWCLRGLLKQNQNRYEEALMDLNHALQMTSQPRILFTIRVLIGWNQIKLTHYSEALQSLFLAEKLVPEEPLSQALLAIAYYHLSEFEKVFDASYKALRSQSSSLGTLDTPQFTSSVFNTMAGSLMKLESWSDAEKALRYAIQLTPALPGPRMNLYIVLGAQGKHKEAERALQDSVNQGIADAKTYEMIAQILYARNNFSEAVRMLRQAYRLNPGNPNIMNALGYTLLQLDTSFEEARDLIKRAVKAEPANANYHDSLGWAHFKLGNLKEAEKELLWAAENNPDSAVTLEHLGDLNRKQDKKADAVNFWKAALNLTTDDGAKLRLRSKIALP